MNRFFRTVLLAAATTAASWAIRKWMDERYTKRDAPIPRKPIESWENEGGALAPHHVAIETSQVPR